MRTARKYPVVVVHALRCGPARSSIRRARDDDVAHIAGQHGTPRGEHLPSTVTRDCRPTARTCLTRLQSYGRLPGNSAIQRTSQVRGRLALYAAQEADVYRAIIG